MITYLQYQLPEDLSRKSLQAVLATERKKEAKTQLTKSVAAIKRVTGSKLDQAVASERAGFEAVIAQDLATARTAVRRAYAAYPEFRNLDEISNKLRVRDFADGSPELRQRILGEVTTQLLAAYAWGIPADLRRRLESMRA